MAKANGMVIKVQPRQYSTSNFELEVLTETSFRKKTKKNIFSDDQIIISDYEIFFVCFKYCGSYSSGRF